MKHWRVVVVAGVVAAGIDLTYALVFYGARGIPPGRIPQSIASGLLGPASFKGGIATILLGIALQFLIGICIAAVYYLASRKLPILLQQAALCGIAYGAAVYCVMHYVVLPLSAAPKGQPAIIAMVTDFVVHLFGVGLPLALIIRSGASEEQECESGLIQSSEVAIVTRIR